MWKYLLFSSFLLNFAFRSADGKKFLLPLSWNSLFCSSKGKFFFPFFSVTVEVFLSIQLHVNTEYSISIQSKFLALYIPAHHQCLMLRYLFSSASCVSTELISFTTMLFEFIIEGLYLSEDWEADRRLIAVGVHMSDIELMLSNRFSEEIDLRWVFKFSSREYAFEQPSN